MPTNKINFRSVWKSKLALGLVPIFVSIVAAPLAVTVVVVGRVGQQQMMAATRSMERSNLSTVQDARQSFQLLGQAALRQSSQKISTVCRSASTSASEQSQKDQAASLAQSGQDFAKVTQSSFDAAMQQSLVSNREILKGVGNQTGLLFANSAHYTQAKVGERVQSAILDQINAQMTERAQQLAQLFDSYVQTNVNYLSLSSEMLDDEQGQKAVLDALVRRFPMMSEVSILDRTGKITVMSAADRVILPADLIDQSFAPYFTTAIQDDTYIGVDHLSVNGEPPVLRLAVPIETYKGKAIGVLSATLSLSDLWDTIRDTHFGKSGFAYVTDGSGYPLLSPRHFDGTVFEQSAPIDSVGWRLVVAQPQLEVMQPIQSFKSDINQHTQRSLIQMHDDILSASRLAAAKQLSDSNALHVATAIKLQRRTAEILRQLNQKTQQKSKLQRLQLMAAIQSQIYAGESENNSRMVVAANIDSEALELRIPVLASRAVAAASRRLRSFAIVIFIVSCILSCLIGVLLAGTLVRPIIELSQGTRSLASGHLDKRVDEHAPAEIGDLAVAFNMMAQSLQKSRAELHDAESQLVQSAKLASLGTLSAGVARELNQPVAIVRGIAQQIKNDASVTPMLKEDLEIIEGQTTRMMRIITHLRTFCRNNGYDPVPVDVNQIVRDCFILISAQLKSNGIKIEMDLCKDGYMVLADANELEQVFINLITNARDAMAGAADPCLSIRSAVQGDTILVEFHDNGSGIPDSVAEHIFDPFFTTKEVGKGTGLGLSISHGIIQKHGGSIKAANDDGAVFSIVLPLEGKQSRSISAKHATAMKRQAA